MSYCVTEIDLIKLSQKLLQIKSVSPAKEESLTILISQLEQLGFDCQKLIFNNTANLYARRGDASPNLAFVGHMDVVPAVADWSFDPFAATIEDGKIFARGAVDMKASIACFLKAVEKFSQQQFTGSISFIISGNEEGDPQDAMIKIIEWLKSKGEKIDEALVGEPTSAKILGDTIKIGRRGSANYSLIIEGIQGHVAYQHLAQNPISELVQILNELKTRKIDEGNANFLASNLEITNILIDNESTNVIPKRAEAKFNIRFNDSQDQESLAAFIENIIKKYSSNYILTCDSYTKAFLAKKGRLNQISKDSIRKIAKIDAQNSTSGGTSDARFIQELCPVVELGLLNNMAHKVDEFVPIDDLLQLTDIYYHILEGFFKYQTHSR